ncbi:hypothetical protein [Asticcacaulis endophyticus]|uniref:Uncharacterized protein n=1 Tax=Asticcacaulis endophyticus TaxID=1395890 RepID=A0A918Q3Q6_9CAUL|nr:hypothetical protein [Asticcacaulis endophyticus]GGZ31951.1 hypothetical protein GCM10011273_17460 [Asticcacaulis endophyticus]
MKVGQHPPWRMSSDANIENMLGEHRDYLSKGLLCESQGYGIAAFSYYRRIVEELIDQLIDDIHDLIEPDHLKKFDEALIEVKKTQQTSEKIELVMDLLPPVLKTEGINPLGILHSIFSEGLHAQTDEECLEDAASLRSVLTFLASQIQSSKGSQRIFSESMKSILDKKNARKQAKLAADLASKKESN